MSNSASKRNRFLTSNTQLRFRCDTTDNADYIYIDKVVISAQ